MEANHEMTRDLDALLVLQDTLTAREIDAGACRTRYDYDRARKARERFEAAYGAFVTRWCTPGGDP